MSEIFIWLLGIAFLGIGVFIIAHQWVAGILVYLSKGSMSFIPVLGGLFTIVGIFILPFDLLKPYWWLALFLDITLVPMALVLSWQYFSKYERNT